MVVLVDGETTTEGFIERYGEGEVAGELDIDYDHYHWRAPMHGAYSDNF